MKKHEKYHSIKQKFKLVGTIISWTLFVLLLLVAGILVYYFITTKTHDKNDTSYKPAFGLYTIISPSMEPSLKIYDVIVNVKVKKPEDIKIGDVITFISTASISKGMTITHRVISITDTPEGKEYQTKGDNNDTPDSKPATFDNVIGKVVLKIPQLGRLQSILSTKGGWLILVVIPAFFIILFDILKLIRLKGAQKQVEEIVKKDEENEESVRKEKQKIEEKLNMRYKQKRSSYEKDPLKKTSIIIEVKEQDTKHELPKLKNDDPKKPRTRKRKKKN